MADMFDSSNQSIENKNYLEELVGDGKKFKTVDELARGKAEADRHIENLNKTLNELRDDLKNRQTTEDLMNRITELSTNRQEERREPNPPQDTNQVTGLKKEDVERMFSERDNANRQRNNLSHAQAQLSERYGDTAPAEVEAKAKELNVTKEYLRDMASTTPSVFLALFTAPPVQKDVFAAPAQGRSTPLNNQLAGVRKWSDFQKMRRENSKEYYDPKTQREMVAIGDKLGGPGNPAYDAWRNS